LRRRLELEITERIFMENSESTLATLRRITTRRASPWTISALDTRH
jgi:EAL domain-containing protein (putative c-di-GMP-specific phosphodiesterase class I)